MRRIRYPEDELCRVGIAAPTQLLGRFEAALGGFRKVAAAASALLGEMRLKILRIRAEVEPTDHVRVDHVLVQHERPALLGVWVIRCNCVRERDELLL